LFLRAIQVSTTVSGLRHIDTMSLNPDTVVDTWMALSKR